MAVDLEAIRKKVQELNSGRKTSNVQLWKPEVGTYKIRGMPWPTQYTQESQPFVELWFYYIGDNPGILAPYQFGKEDPIHEFRNQLFKSGKPEDKQIAKKLRASMRAYMPIVVKE